jgi:ABC-type branched-subunit amino acid transport system ATPase component
VVEKGRDVWHGTTAQFQADPAVRHDYLGV